MRSLRTSRSYAPKIAGVRDGPAPALGLVIMKSSFKVVSFVVLSASLVFACGGSSSDERKADSKGDAGSTSGAVNGDKGGKTGGLLGGIKDTTGKGGDACKPASDDAACTSCIKGSCCAEAKACDGDCQAIFDCADTCGEDEDGACADACVAKHMGGRDAAVALAMCVAGSCATQCAGGDEPAAGEKCIGEPKTDAQYCPDPTKPVLRDCPGGSPADACSLSPTDAANVYCCPAG